nr:hypothetical protein [Propionibacterium sp.]
MAHRLVALACCLALAGCAPTPTASPTPTPTGGPTASVTATTVPSTSAPTTATPGAPGTPGPTATPWVDAQRHAAFVKAARKVDGRLVLDLDLVLFLTGPEAEDAAEADGAEPPPNDFYIVNDSPRVRTLPVAADAPLTVVMDVNAALVPEGMSMPLGVWTAALDGPHGEALRSTPYWVTVTDGTITAISQQYVP